ncbi:MAG: AI-2E family transporter, partial [Opitutales bacterium]
MGIVLCFAAAIFFLFLLGLVTWSLAKALVFFSGVIWPLAMAGILSIMLRPVVACFEERLSFNRIGSVFALYALVVLVAGIGVYFIAPKVIAQIDELTQTAPAWPKQITESLKSWLPEEVQDTIDAVMEEWGVFDSKDATSIPAELEGLSPQEKEEWLQRQQEMNRNRMLENLQQQGGALAEKTGEAFNKAKEFLFLLFKNITYLAIIPIYMFYFLGSRRDLLDDAEEELNFLRPYLRSDLIFLAREFVSIVVAFFRGQLLIAMIMGSLYALGFYLAGLKFGLALGFLFGFLNIVPYLGSIVGLSVVVPLSYFQDGGGLDALGFCMGTFVLVQLLESYYLTPKIMGEKTGMHPVVVILAIFFWGTALGGILGMIAAIPLTAFLIVAWRLLRRKYLGGRSLSTETSSAN